MQKSKYTYFTEIPTGLFYGISIKNTVFLFFFSVVYSGSKFFGYVANF